MKEEKLEVKEVLGVLEYLKQGYDFAAEIAEKKEERLFLTGCHIGVNNAIEVIEKKLNKEVIK